MNVKTMMYDNGELVINVVHLTNCESTKHFITAKSNINSQQALDGLCQQLTISFIINTSAHSKY